MLISHEVPLGMLQDSYQFNDYDYCLVHLYESIPAYREFYFESVKQGRTVLLDNSIFELGVAFESSKFAQVIEQLRPTYYIIPDVLEDSKGTIESYKRFMAEYSSLEGVRIGVVQGKTYNELVECYKFMADNADYIALSFDLSVYEYIGTGHNKLQRQCTGRPKVIRMMLEDYVICTSKPHHLLGCSLAREFGLYEDHMKAFIRSCDTSNPIVAGLLGQRYSGTFGLQHKNATKLADLINAPVSEEQRGLAKNNVRLFRKIVHG